MTKGFCMEGDMGKHQLIIISNNFVSYMILNTKNEELSYVITQLSFLECLTPNTVMINEYNKIEYK